MTHSEARDKCSQVERAAPSTDCQRRSSKASSNLTVDISIRIYTRGWLHCGATLLARTTHVPPAPPCNVALNSNSSDNPVSSKSQSTDRSGRNCNKIY